MTALSIPQIPTAETVGLHRRMSRITDDAGLIRTIAIDHPDNYLLLFDDDLTKVSFEEVHTCAVRCCSRLVCSSA